MSAKPVLPRTAIDRRASSGVALCSAGGQIQGTIVVPVHRKAIVLAAGWAVKAVALLIWHLVTG